MQGKRKHATLFKNSIGVDRPISNATLKRTGMVKARNGMKRQPGASFFKEGCSLQPIEVEPRVITHSSSDYMSGDGCLF